MLLALLVVVSVVSFAFAQSDYADGAWRKSLDGEGACWNDRSCQRVMTCAHGGEWDFKYPYDSMPAFQRAFDDGADAIKGGMFFAGNLFFFFCPTCNKRLCFTIDFRVAKDNVGMVMHSR